VDLRVEPAGESGYHVIITDGVTTLIDRNDALSARECHTLFELLQRPGLPDIRFVREASWSKVRGRQYSFSCHFLTRDEQVDFGRSPHFASEAEVFALIERVQSDTPVTLAGDLPPAPEKRAKTPKKPAKR
jgi:hypothetical protein